MLLDPTDEITPMVPTGVPGGGVWGASRLAASCASVYVPDAVVGNVVGVPSAPVVDAWPPLPKTPLAPGPAVGVAVAPAIGVVRTPPPPHAVIVAVIAQAMKGRHKRPSVRSYVIR